MIAFDSTTLEGSSLLFWLVVVLIVVTVIYLIRRIP